MLETIVYKIGDPTSLFIKVGFSFSLLVDKNMFYTANESFGEDA